MSQQHQFKWAPQPDSSPQPEPLSPSSPLSQDSPSLQTLYNIAYPSSAQQPHWDAQGELVPVCMRCGKALSFLEQLAYDKQMQCCQTCSSRFDQSLQRFRATFLEVTRSGAFSSAEWATLQQYAAQERLALSQALPFILKDAVELAERIIVQAEANGEVTEATQRNILQLQKTLAIPTELAQPLFQRLAYGKKLTNIRKGRLPKITTKVQLDADEVCHLEVSTIYHKVNLKTTVPIIGRLVATSKKLVFLSPMKGMTMSWHNIMNVEIRSLTSPDGGVYLEVARGAGNGLYAVSDPTYVGTLLDVLVKIAKYQLVSETDVGRRISHDVKIVVWQRDGGKCAQCGATNDLEFDHIIPRAKGGGNSLANIQLLCHRCNLKKRDRI